MTEQIWTKTIAIASPVSKVWEALTNPELIRQWMWDDEFEVLTDWKQGSPIVFKANLHGRQFEAKGIVQQFEPEKILQYTHWTKISRLPDLPEHYALLEFHLLPAQSHTNLTFTHKHTAIDETHKHNSFYWETTLQVLKKFVESEKEE